MPLSGFTYHRLLTDANSTTLSNFVTRVDLTSANFDFTKAKSDGSDLRVRDETAGALVPIWLADYDAVGQTGRLYYRAVATGHSHALYFGNTAATSVSTFLTASSGVFDHGSGFDTNFGDLSLANSGDGYALQVPASSGGSDARNFSVWSLAELPTLQYSDTGFSDGLYTGVREMSLIRDAVTNLPLLIGGKYYITFARRSASTTDKLDAAIASSTSQYGPWSNFSVFYDPPSTVRLGYPSSALKVGSTYVVYFTYGWDTGGAQTPALSPYVMTSTDLVTWSAATQALLPSIWTDPSTAQACTQAGNPWVIRCADGTYFMTCEAYDSAHSSLFWVVFGATATDPINGPWTAVNSGAALVSYGAGGTWDAASAANPKVMQRPDGSFAMQYSGFADGITGNAQLGYAFSASRAGPWTKATSNPMAGRFAPSYGLEGSALHYDVDGTSLLNYGQRFGDSGTGSSSAKIYRMQPMLKRGGLLVSSAETDAAAMGTVLAAGTFTAESRSSFTSHRATSATPDLLALLDYAAVPAATTSATIETQRRVSIFRWSHDLPQNNISGYGPGDVTFVYWDASNARHYWNGSIWMTPGVNGGRNLPADHGREVLATISDDGTNFILSAVYGDDGSAIPGGSATIAKASVKSFSAGRVLMAGDPCTDAFGSGLFFRRMSVRPYAVIEPAITVGASVQDEATAYTLVAPSPSTGPVGSPSAVFTVTPNALCNRIITITPSGGGLSTPVVLTFSSATPQTFTITPTLTGTITLTATNSGSLTDPAPVTYAATPAAPTTTQFPVITQAFTSDRAAFIGYTIKDLTGAVITARATAGITFIGNAFVALAAVPRTGNFVVDWDDTLVHDTMLVADPIVDGTVTSTQAQALMLAADTSVTTDGGLTFYAPDKATPRFTGTTSGGDRVTSVLTPPT